MRQVIVFVALLSVALGHSWMQVPLGGYAQQGVPSANQTAPCGFNANFVAATQVTAGDLLPVSWPMLTHGGETTPVTLRLLATSNQLPVATLTSVPFNTNGGNIDVRIPFDQSGDFFLQWTWLDFFTCSQIQIAASNISVTVVPANDTTVSGAAQPAVLEYYNFVGNSNNQNFLVTINGPTGSKFVEIFTGGNNVGIPTAQTFTERFDTSVASEIAFGVCNDGNLQDLFAGVQGSAATTGDAYTVRASSYNSLVNVGTIFTSGAHNGHRYFTTQAFETFGEPRRVVVTATAPITTPNFDFVVDTTCTFDSNNLVTGTKIGDSIGCIQLSTRQGTKFIQVPAINSQYTIKTENGLCGDIAAGSYIQASLVLLLALIGGLLL